MCNMDPGSSDRLLLTNINFCLTGGGSLTCQTCQPALGSNGNGKRQSCLPLNSILSALREALPLGLRSVQLSGGDALLHTDIDSLLDQLENLELAVTLETSGSGLTPERAERLARLPQCSVLVGLDGVDAATHNAIHHTPGAYEMAVQAVKLLAKNGLRPHLIFSIQRHNAGQAQSAVRLAEGLGASSLRFVTPRSVFSPYNGKNGSSGHNSILQPPNMLEVEELIALGWRVERRLANATPLHLHFDQPPAFRGLHPQARIEGQGPCDVLHSLAVLNTGQYGLCSTARGIPELVLGRAGVDPLETIWHTHPLLTALREGVPARMQGVCDRCIMKTACLGNCPADNYLRSGSFQGPYWFCETAERAGLFPAGRLIENVW